MKILPKGEYPDNWNWRWWSADAFRCQHTGRIPDTNDPSSGDICDFLDYMVAVRDEWGYEMVITSGYRDAAHPLERKKGTTGAHVEGCAMDIGTGGDGLEALAQTAIKVFDASDFSANGLGIGINTRKNFIHIDRSPTRRAKGKVFRWHYN